MPLLSAPGYIAAPAQTLGNLQIRGPRPYVDATHPYFGMTAGAATGNAAALNQAMALIDDYPEGLDILIPGGIEDEFPLDGAIVPRSNVRLISQSRLIRKSGQAITMFAAASALTNFQMLDLELDANVTTWVENALGPKVLTIPAASSDITLDGVRMINLGQVGDQIAIGGDGLYVGPSQTRNITLKHLRLSRSLALGTNIVEQNENTRTLVLWDPSDSVLEDCRFTGINSVQFVFTNVNAIDEDNPAMNAWMKRCIFRDIPCTAAMVQARDDAELWIINSGILDCEFYDVGVWAEKGAILAGTNGLGLAHYVNLDVSRIKVRGFGYHGSRAVVAFDANPAPQAILIGGCDVQNLRADQHDIDGRSVAGVLPGPTANGAGGNIGTRIGGANGFSSSGHLIRNCGMAGLQTLGIPGDDLWTENGVLAGNTVLECGRVVSGDVADYGWLGGIDIHTGSRHLRFLGGVSRNHGDADTHAASQVAGVSFYNSPDIYDILVQGVDCSASNGFQQYGVRIGVSGLSAANAPLRIQVKDNDVRGNAAAGVYYNTAADLSGWDIRNNDGEYTNATNLPVSKAGTADLNLTTSLQDVPGVELTLRPGVYALSAQADLHLTTTDTGAFILIASFAVISGTATINPAIHAGILDGALGTRLATSLGVTLTVTATAVIRLQARKSGGSGVDANSSKCYGATSVMHAKVA